MAAPKWHFERLDKPTLIRAILRDGRSQRQIAREAGISKTGFYLMTDMSSNRKYIQPQTLDKLCKVLNVPREELIW